VDLRQVSLRGSGTLDDCALTIIAMVVSDARPDRDILDGDRTTFAGENHEWGTYGRTLDRPEIVVTRATDEDGIVISRERVR
jgi:hypothetical protein